MPTSSVHSVTSDPWFPSSREHLETYGYCVVSGGSVWPSGMSSDRSDLGALWDHLGADRYLQVPGFRRERRYARLSARLNELGEAVVVRLRDEPFVQHTADNPRFDGVARWFDACDRGLTRNTAFLRLLAHDLQLIAGDTDAWDVGVHQIRLVWDGEGPANATPEGAHSDGHRYVAVHLIALPSSRFSGGISRVFTSRADQRPVLAWRMEEPGDTLVLDDRRVLHEVSPVNADRPGHRDVLIFDFLRARLERSDRAHFAV